MLNDQFFQVWTVIGEHAAQQEVKSGTNRSNLLLLHVLIGDEFTILDVQLLQELATAHTQVFQHPALHNERRRLEPR